MQGEGIEWGGGGDRVTVREEQFLRRWRGHESLKLWDGHLLEVLAYNEVTTSALSYLLDRGILCHLDKREPFLWVNIKDALYYNKRKEISDINNK